MTDAEITGRLDELAREAGAASFWHGPDTKKDINYNAAFPQAHLFLMPSKLKNGRVITQVGMCFYGKDEHQNFDAKSFQIQDDMDVLTQKFYSLFADVTEFELVDGEMERGPVYRKGASIGTGYMVTFKLSSLAIC